MEWQRGTDHTWVHEMVDGRIWVDEGRPATWGLDSGHYWNEGQRVRFEYQAAIKPQRAPNVGTAKMRAEEALRAKRRQQTRKEDWKDRKKRDARGGPTLHVFDNLSDREMYDETQVNEALKDGDVFVCCNGKVVGFKNSAWPVVLYGKSRSLHVITRHTYEKLLKLYPKTLELAAQAAAERNLPKAFDKYEAMLPWPAVVLLTKTIGEKKAPLPDPQTQLRMVRKAAQLSAERSLAPVLAESALYVREAPDGWSLCDNWERFSSTILEFKNGQWYKRKMYSDLPGHKITYQQALGIAEHMFG